MPPPAPFGYGAYEPPASQARRPAVILWYRVYAVVGAAFYVTFLLAWRGMWIGPSDPTQVPLVAAICLSLAALHLVGAAVPFKPWGWTYGLAVICFGMLFCLFPFSVALVIHWSYPTTKAAFGRM